MDDRAPTSTLADRRRHPRFPVDIRATLFMLLHGSELSCTLNELSLDGCRLRTDREYLGGAEIRVELGFTARGMCFRISGVTQWTSGKIELGIRFVGMSARREAELAELLAEIEAELEASAEKDAGASTCAQQTACAARAEVERLEQELAEKIQTEAAARRAMEQAAQERLQVSLNLEQAQVARTGAERVCADLAAREAARHAALAACEAPEPENEPDSDPTPPIQAAPPVPAAPITGAHPVVTPETSAPSASHSNGAATHQGTTPPEKPGRDRREETRHAVDSQAVIFLLDVHAQITARILDVSPSGCRMRCTDKFPVGIYRRVEVEFVLDGLPFRLPGVVQSMHDAFTTGIRFLNVSERKQEQLEQLIDEMSDIKRAAGAA